jgi:hypothetical protein
VAQYPAERQQGRATEVHRFLDCKEQRYRDLAAGRRRWVVNLELLDETEMARLARFFDQQQGRLGTFDFEDPWTGMAVPSCRFAEDVLPVTEACETRVAASVTVEEVPA